MSISGASVLYSLSLKSVGRSTHAAGTAGAHLRYILRRGACRTILGRGIPAIGVDAAAWMDAQEAGDRANARVCDGVLVALPHILSHEQQQTLLRDWCNDVSGGVPYIAAIHHPSHDGDQRNDHAHAVFRDRDPTTGRRVMLSTDKAFADRMRLSWETHVNFAMANAGLDERTDRRSNAERGISRTPQIHVGPAATAAARRAQRNDMTPAGRPSAAKPLRSAARTVRNGVGARSPTRVVDYKAIDAGRTRGDENARRIAANAARDRAEARAAMEAKLAAARTSMISLGLGVMPGLLDENFAPPSGSPRPPARVTAADLAAVPMIRRAADPTIQPAKSRSAAMTLALGGAMPASMDAQPLEMPGTAPTAAPPQPAVNPAASPRTAQEPPSIHQQFLASHAQRVRRPNPLAAVAQAYAKSATGPSRETPPASPQAPRDPATAQAAAADRRLSATSDTASTAAPPQPAAPPAPTARPTPIMAVRDPPSPPERRPILSDDPRAPVIGVSSHGTARIEPYDLAEATRRLLDGDVIQVNRNGDAAVFRTDVNEHSANSTKNKANAGGLFGLGLLLNERGVWHKYQTPLSRGWISIEYGIVELATMLTQMARDAADEWIYRLRTATRQSRDRAEDVGEDPTDNTTRTPHRPKRGRGPEF